MVGADQFFDTAAYASALEWWHDAGVDILADANPRDWLAPPPLPPVRPAASEAAAPQLPPTLEAFLAWRAGADAPDARWGGKNVLAEGPTDAELMVLLDHPDRDDCEAGRLLSGSAGRLFDRMLAAIGLSRDGVYVASVCVRRPASGRSPRDAVTLLAAAAMHHAGLVRPKRLLLLGDAASRAVLGADASATRGIYHAVHHNGGRSGAVVSFHPRLLLQRPAAKADAWRDLRLLRDGGRE